MPHRRGQGLCDEASKANPDRARRRGQHFSPALRKSGVGATMMTSQRGCSANAQCSRSSHVPGKDARPERSSVVHEARLAYPHICRVCSFASLRSERLTDSSPSSNPPMRWCSQVRQPYRQRTPMVPSLPLLSSLLDAANDRAARLWHTVQEREDRHYHRLAAPCQSGRIPVVASASSRRGLCNFGCDFLPLRPRTAGWLHVIRPILAALSRRQEDVLTINNLKPCFFGSLMSDLPARSD